MYATHGIEKAGKATWAIDRALELEPHIGAGKRKRMRSKERRAARARWTEHLEKNRGAPEFAKGKAAKREWVRRHTIKKLMPLEERVNVDGAHSRKGLVQSILRDREDRNRREAEKGAGVRR